MATAAERLRARLRDILGPFYLGTSSSLPVDIIRAQVVLRNSTKYLSNRENLQNDLNSLGSAAGVDFITDPDERRQVIDLFGRKVEQSRDDPQAMEVFGTAPSTADRAAQGIWEGFSGFSADGGGTSGGGEGQQSTSAGADRVLRGLAPSGGGASPPSTDEGGGAPAPPPPAGHPPRSPATSSGAVR